ncbi:MFS transporter [Dietzia aerolata]|uniref:MFS transporter n=1 Tax=Dietzia aerolata TaxID=595984 RepID=A0ABV5JNT8_9ACTN|nr:MFS transporter [Dietzia aerolata]MBB0968365.1 MFS transporter [Dietzia aerolata]
MTRHDTAAAHDRTVPGTTAHPGQRSRRRVFWASASVLALALWSSGAPSVLYPMYADLWGLTPAVITAVFATYQLAIIIVLPLFGGLSDQLGRRRVMIIGLTLIAGSAVLFALAPNVGFLFAGRVLQGAGTGLAMGAATASLVENNVSANPRFASTLATISTATGLTLALVLSGVFARFLPMPMFWSYIVLLGLTIFSVIALALSPDDRPAHAPRWRPQPLRLVPGVRPTFAIATLSVALAYCVGAIMLSLGAHMVRQFTQTEDAMVTGLLLGCSSAAIGLTALFLSRLPVQAAVVIGALLSVGSLTLMVLAAASGSIKLFFAWSLVGGIAYSFAFSGGLGVMNRTAPDEHRGAILSLLYLVAYFLQGAVAIGVGLLATTKSLSTAVTASALFLGCLCVVVLVLLMIARRTHKAFPRPADCP